MDLERARSLAGAGLANLELHQRRINALNVYPVPDGDTGTNLTQTVRGIVAALDASAADTPAAVAEELRRAALMEAKGNSGVILSQIVRGLAEVIGGHDEVDAAILAEALRAAATRAYQGVERPVEGTMLTVIREMAEEAEEPAVRALPVAEALEVVVQRADAAVARTPDQLAVLREAGVVDAGGAGLAEIFRGIHAGLAGIPLPDAPTELDELSEEAIHQEQSRYRYCTVFLVEGEGLDREALHDDLTALGDSLLIVGDERLMKVHVHTDEPERALTAGRSVGVVDPQRVEIGDMHEQTSEREGWLTRLRRAATAEPVVTGLVAVAAGDGNRAIFESEGASLVIDGGQTMNPSVGQILEAVTAVNAEDVIVLPNNRNIQLAAENAAAESTKDVRVLATSSVPQGMVATFAFDPGTGMDDNAETMRDAIAGVVTGEVTVAARDATVDGQDVLAGHWLGLVDDRAVASGPELWDVIDAVVDRVLTDGRSLLTVLTGDRAPADEAIHEHVRGRHPDADVSVHAGGQPHYPLLLWAE